MSNSKTRRRRELEMARAQRAAERRQAARRRRQRIITIVAAALVVVLGGTITAVVLATTGDGGTATATASPSASANAATTKVGDCVYTKDASGQAPAKDVSMPAAAPAVSTKPATMTINTNLGTMVATLDPAKAPCTVHAMYALAQQKYFDDTPCHRETFGPEAGIYVLQCGDPTGTGSGSPGFTYKNENTAGVNYNRGVLAMANAGADTNGSQFFINYADPSEEGAQALAGGYTVFGQITQGLDILDKITSPGVEEGGSDGAPVTKPQITSITVDQEQPAATGSASPAPATSPAASPAPTATASPTS
ncbi:MULTISPECIES: peptidylprolyl isomerase [unclassified Pseudofrankia]|uniref:peptidylprolyl isomerase n=1 Tax=unclassified Pseudofrankia TaxID=2994372 RepID=UPI0008D9BA68|nr:MULTISPECIES: peptidylprolyl isomerase [unclassified Pseudofrankia]MDT3445310.1 peptidylprolyl isomerase [Pseudofrankia sp. BMG5.37]OHV45263.1 peptidylprolyl isomerase [Pseudofrankia sp. BMG5.36]